jgi:hypothetical protein
MGIFYPVRIKKNNPNKGRAPFDDKGNDNSVPVPGHPDWAKKMSADASKAKPKKRIKKSDLKKRYA